MNGPEYAKFPGDYSPLTNTPSGSFGKNGLSRPPSYTMYSQWGGNNGLPRQQYQTGNVAQKFDPYVYSDSDKVIIIEELDKPGNQNVHQPTQHHQPTQFVTTTHHGNQSQRKSTEQEMYNKRICCGILSVILIILVLLGIVAVIIVVHYKFPRSTRDDHVR